jgi:NodT family efflux transporter outer membrane factor (OMF) lipoprotein
VEREQNLFQAGFDANWEIDVFGGVRRAVEASEADIQAAEEAQRYVLVSLLSEVGRNYIEARSGQRRLAIAHENIVSQRDTLELTRTRFNAGLTSELDVAQAESQLATTQSQVPLLEVLVKQAIHRLGVLLGQPPESLLDELNREAPIPTLPPQVPVGLPSDLLERRPDIRRSERELAAATARIGVATSELFPRFSLTGSFGSQTDDMQHFLDRKSLFWSVGPTMSWPVFDAGRIRANIDMQDARQQQALMMYQQAILIALEEVENTLVAYRQEQVRHKHLTTAVQANRRAVDVAHERYTKGLADFLSVLESQRALYVTEDAMVQSEGQAVGSLIALYKALGGGWEAGE